MQLLTYATSYNMLPAVRDLDVPVVLLKPAKEKAPDYAHTDTPTWLGELTPAARSARWSLIWSGPASVTP